MENKKGFLVDNLDLLSVTEMEQNAKETSLSAPTLSDPTSRIEAPSAPSTVVSATCLTFPMIPVPSGAVASIPSEPQMPIFSPLHNPQAFPPPPPPPASMLPSEVHLYYSYYYSMVAQAQSRVPTGTPGLQVLAPMQVTNAQPVILKDQPAQPKDAAITTSASTPSQVSVASTPPSSADSEAGSSTAIDWDKCCFHCQKTNDLKTFEDAKICAGCHDDLYKFKKPYGGATVIKTKMQEYFPFSRAEGNEIAHGKRRAKASGYMYFTYKLETVIKEAIWKWGSIKEMAEDSVLKKTR